MTPHRNIVHLAHEEHRQLDLGLVFVEQLPGDMRSPCNEVGGEADCYRARSPQKIKHPTQFIVFPFCYFNAPTFPSILNNNDNFLRIHLETSFSGYN